MLNILKSRKWETYYEEGNPKITHVFKRYLLMDSAAFVCKGCPVPNLYVKQIPYSSALRQYLYDSRLRYATSLRLWHPFSTHKYIFFFTRSGLSSFLGFAGKLRTAG